MRLRMVFVLASLGCACGCAPEPPISIETIFLRPAAQVAHNPADMGFEYEALDIPISNKRHVSIWHVKAADPRGVVVIIPGSDQNKGRYLVGLPVFVPSGFDVILMDYEGFGDSSGGSLDLRRLLDDGLAVLDYAQSQHENVIAFGVSTGTAVTTWAAAHRELKAVMLEACLILREEPRLYLDDVLDVDVPFLWDVAQWYIELFTPDGFDILKYIPRVEEPKLFLHSTEDDVTPFRGGQAVFGAALDPKEFFEMRGRHGKMVEVDFDAYSARINEWLDRQIPKSEPVTGE